VECIKRQKPYTARLLAGKCVAHDMKCCRFCYRKTLFTGIDERFSSDSHKKILGLRMKCCKKAAKFSSNKDIAHIRHHDSSQQTRQMCHLVALYLHESEAYFNRLNTLLMALLPAPSGSWRMAFSSSAIIRNSASMAFCVT